VRYGEVKHGIAEELQSLVIGLLSTRMHRAMGQGALKPCLLGEGVLEASLDLSIVFLSERISNRTTILAGVVSVLGGDLKDSKSHL
jgi:hypothetical protein